VNTLWLRGDAGFAREATAELSAPLARMRAAAEAIWVASQPELEAFEYVHARGGQIVRELVYGCTQERIWERVEGAAEPWELWRRPPKLGSANFSFRGDPVAAITAHFKLR
jgi:hypothetical protein